MVAQLLLNEKEKHVMDGILSGVKFDGCISKSGTGYSVLFNDEKIQISNEFANRLISLGYGKAA